MKKIDWKEILLFYTIAVLVSLPFRLDLVQLNKVLPLPAGLGLVYSILRGIGPAVGFVVMFYLLNSRVKRTLSFFGTDRYPILLAVLVIPTGLTVVGVPNEVQLNEHYFGFMYGMVLMVYALGEEYGWRGYLQEALAPLSTLRKVLIIGVLWYLWHLNFLRPEISLQTHCIHFGSILLGSWGLLRITDTSHSILFASAVHLSFNLFTDVRGDLNGRLIVLAISVLVWVFIMRYLVQKKKSERALFMLKPQNNFI